MVQSNEGTETVISDEEKNQTPTAEERMKALQDQVQFLTAEKNRLEGGYKGLQKSLSEKDRDLKRLGDLDSRITGLQDTMELMATAIAARGEVTNLDTEERQDILADIKKKRDEQERKRKQSETETAQQEYAQKANGIYAKAIEIFGDNDDEIDKVADLLSKGWLDRAEARITKAEQKKKALPEKENMETEEQRINRLAEERLNKILEERGLLENYSSTPSGSSSAMEAMQKYISGEITADEAVKRGAKF